MVPKSTISSGQFTWKVIVWLVDTVGEGKGGTIERVALEHIHCITICKIDSQWEFAVWLRELKQGLCNNLEWDGEGDGRGVQEEGDIYIPMADSCWYMTENNKTM